MALDTGEKITRFQRTDLPMPMAVIDRAGSQSCLRQNGETEKFSRLDPLRRDSREISLEIKSQRSCSKYA